jgi:folate-binding protein YgfZ
MPTETISLHSETVPNGAADLTPLLTSAGFALADSIGFIHITGEDRVRWLNGMTTNSIAALKPGEGCYTFFLNAQGRIQGDAIAWLLPDSILLETALDQVPTLIAHLDHFIIMDDVELKPIDPATETGILIAGPEASQVLNRAGFELPPTDGLRFHHDQVTYVGVQSMHSPLVPRFELWVHKGDFAALSTCLTEAGATETTPEAFNQLRLLEGTPLYGTDIRDRDLPQETAQPHALHFAKGCYLGQEIVERIRSRGNVHRTLSGFTLSGPVPTRPASLFNPAAPDKPLGELTSAARIQLPNGPITLALAIIRREPLETNAPIHYAQGTATPVKLPYNLAASEIGRTEVTHLR